MQVLIVAFVVVGIIFLISNRFKKKCYQNFDTKIHFDQVRMIQDEDFYYELELTNRKFMILPIIKIAVRVPSCFDIANMEGNPQSEMPYTYTVTTSLFWFQRLKRKIRLMAHSRGVYEVETTITFMDLFGLVRVNYPETIKSRIMIHPKALDTSFNVVSKQGLQGNDVVQRWINKDPLLYSGFRDYTYTDSVKDIDWKMSAKQASLVVKTYDATSDPSIVFLYVGYKDEHYYTKQLETNISLLARLIQDALEKRVPVSFNTNFVIKGKMKQTTGLENNQNHRIRILDMLACITYATGLDATSYLLRSLPKWGQHHVFVIVMRYVEEEALQIIQQFAHRGYQIQLFVQEPLKQYIRNVEVIQMEVEPHDE